MRGSVPPAFPALASLHAAALLLWAALATTDLLAGTHLLGAATTHLLAATHLAGGAATHLLGGAGTHLLGGAGTDLLGGAGIGILGGGALGGIVVLAAFGLIGAVAALGVARQAGFPRRARLGWALVAAGSLGLAAGAEIVFTVALLVALHLFPLTPTIRRRRWRGVLDASIVTVGASMALLYAAGLSPLHVLDLALLFTVVRVLLRGATGAGQVPLRLLTAGVLVNLAADLAAPGALTAGAAALVAAAALAQNRAEPVGERSRAFLNRYLHYGAVAMANGMMVVAAVRSGSFVPWGGLVLGGALLSGLVLWRQALVQRESDERAVTDSLTGLANRARVRAWSTRALARGARTGRHSAVLVIDMNGFKEVNDTLGHHYGDLVLVAFADVLRRCVPAPGMPGRLGGDEFAAVLPDLEAPEQAYEIAGLLAAELAPVVIGGKLITLAASIGVAVAGPGELTHDQLVHRADLAMYQAKKRGPQTRWAAWQESFEERDLPSAA